jgi:hypothetical protein
MIVNNKNGFIKYECQSCLGRFRVAQSDFKGDFCGKCSKQHKDTFTIEEIILVPHEVTTDNQINKYDTMSIPTEISVEEIKVDQRHVETEKIINKKSKKNNKVS